MIEAAPQQPSFDGIICIGGEDWWYHNRGHFDFQIMRRLARRWPVLFVNSLGVRMPSLRHDRHFAARIGRKLKSFARGLAHIENGFWVFSPVTAPGAAVASLSRWALAPQIRIAAARAGIRRPLLWIHCPPGVALIDQLPHTAVVMQRTDRFEAFPDADPALVGCQIRELKKRADLVVYAAEHLREQERNEVAASVLVTHGVDLDAFVRAGRGDSEIPADIAQIARPRIGFIGGIDSHPFDPELFLAVAASRPQYNFVMVGGCSLPEGWCSLPNVHQLGRKPYDEIAAYMAVMDVLTMPWNRSEWIKACNPIKLKEYLAVGRPVVTTDFPALDPWRDLVHIAGEAVAFSAAIDGALREPTTSDAALGRLQHESWSAKADLVAATLVRLAGARQREGAAAA